MNDTFRKMLSRYVETVEPKPKTFTNLLGETLGELRTLVESLPENEGVSADGFGFYITVNGKILRSEIYGNLVAGNNVLTKMVCASAEILQTSVAPNLTKDVVPTITLH